jgi:predicted dehydrogenase
MGDGRPLGYAVVGCGRISESHLRAARALPDDLDLRAVVDVVEEKARRRAREFGVPAAYTRLEDALADERIKIIDICTQPVFHAPLGVRAAGAGKHVLIEKPLCLSVKEADALIAAGRAAGVTVMSGQSRRFNDPVLAAKRLIASGQVGRLLHIQVATGSRTEGPPIAWWGDEAMTGPSALLANWASHWLDQIVYLAGRRPLRVMAEAASHHDTYAGEDEWSILIRFEGDLIAAYTHSFNCQLGAAGGFEYAGTKATLEIRGKTLLLDGRKVEGVGENINNFTAMLKELADAVRGGRPPLCSAEEVRDAIAIAEAALMSARQGRAVSLDELAPPPGGPA